jgi:hypothetical protein
VLEPPHRGTVFGAATVFWINERSRLWTAALGGRAADADLVWVLGQDPLGPAARRWLAERLPSGVPVLNPPAVHDAYHAPDAFPRLAAAGVRVPRTTFGPADVGRTAVLHKPVGTQGRAGWAVYDGPRPGYRTFAVEDGRGTDGLHRRYRAFVLGDLVLAEDAIAAAQPEVRARTLVAVERSFALTGHERAQLLLLARTLGLGFCAVDFLRRRADGLPVFLDVNVYPTVVGAWSGDMPGGDSGQWHVFDNAARLGLGPPVWDRVDEALAALASAPAQEAAA